MAGERREQAVARIEAALRRIELATQNRTTTSSGDEMEQRYNALWIGTSAALAELDALIGSIER